MRWVVAVFFACAGLVRPVAAAQLSVHLTDDHGKAISDAVVTLAPDSAISIVAARPPPATHVIDQKDETFIPYVQVFRPGDWVVFRNSDTTRHHVYSFSNVKRFDFVLKPGQSSPAILLDKPGIAAVGCNIHDQMATYLFISAVASIAISEKSGDAVFNDVASGNYTVHVWHPQLPPGQTEPTQKVTIAAGSPVSRLAFTFALLPDPRATMDLDHAQ
jgi:plastocyanin